MTDENDDELLMTAAKKIYHDCLLRGKEDEDEVYKAFRNNITDPVRTLNSHFESVRSKLVPHVDRRDSHDAQLVEDGRVRSQLHGE